MFSGAAAIALVIGVLAGAAADDGDVCRNQEEGERLSSANNQFALELYNRQAANTEGNIFFSPLSISVALGMTYLGARGETKQQMKRVLHYGQARDDDLHQCFADIQSALNQPHQKIKLYTANRLFGDKSIKLLDKFLEDGRKYYSADLKTLDFR